MKLPLSEDQIEKLTVHELARLILRLVVVRPGGYNFSDSVVMLEHLYPQGGVIDKTKSNDFCSRYFEAIALLKRRGLLIEIPNRWRRAFWKTIRADDLDEHYVADHRDEHYVFPTSVGKKTDFRKEILILVDDAQEIVNSLKQDVPDLDPVVEQYYLESLRACQEGLYISSVICLGAASERAVHCLADAVVKHDPSYGSKIKSRRREVSRLIKYLADEIDNVFGSIADKQLIRELKEQLDLVAHIYRLNRNEAGHPKKVPDVDRCTQETYLCSFHQYCRTIFKGVAVLNPNP